MQREVSFVLYYVVYYYLEKPIETSLRADYAQGKGIV